jgi:hypothetical protein
VGLPAATMTWLNAIKANFPPSLTFTVPNGGDTILDANGSLIGTWADGGGGTVTGTGVGGFLKGTGVRVVWGTAGITAGRRVKGTTFLVPLQGTDFDASGALAPASLTSLNTPTQSFLTAMGGALMIWSRPFAGDTTPGHVRPARAGTSHAATSATIPSTVSTLRTRRT